MKKFLPHEISAIKNDFREHPILSLFQYSAILLVCAVVLYILFNDKYHFESKALLILAIILLCNKVNRLEKEILWKDSHIEELKQENKKVAEKNLEILELKSKLRELRESFGEEIIASSTFRAELSAKIGKAELERIEREIELEIQRHNNAKYYNLQSK